MDSNIREPKQKRAIEKKEKIINAGFKLICENGYYNTNTKEIAKEANVSTGIIYQYFNDKKEIFLEGVKNYANEIMYPIINTINNENINNLDDFFINIIDKYVEIHKKEKKAHEELTAMAHLDDDIKEIFTKQELVLTNKITTLLKENGINIKNLNEKIHLIISIIDNYSHEVIYHKHKEINYKIMKEEIIKIIINILK